MKKIVFFLSLFFTYVLQAQEESLLQPGRIIFYNTENLFDTIDDPTTKDEEFLPASKLKWDTEKYQTKLQRVSKVIASLLDSIQPIAIGLAEVENKKVLEDLLEQPEMKKYNFGIAHHDSPDERGADVAILYNRDIVEVLFDSYLKVELPNDNTRDIIYIKGYMTEEDALWIFVNHWPSRRVTTDPDGAKRMVASKVLADKIENIYMGNPDARIIVMGDFNDNPTDSSVMMLSKRTHKDSIINLMQPLYKKSLYTTTFKEKKDVFDQLLVSKNLLTRATSYNVRNNEARIYSPQWLLFNHPQYGNVPNRTYYNGKYVNGYSDHLPVYLDIVFP